MLLRDVTEADLDTLYEHQRDPESARMAAFPSRDREAFLTHWRTRVLPETRNTRKVIEVDGVVVGNILAWTADGRREVGYWIAKEDWGKGIASRAVAELVAKLETTRPLHADVAQHNAGSVRVLEKCGFVRVGEPVVEGDGTVMVAMRLD